MLQRLVMALWAMLIAANVAAANVDVALDAPDGTSYHASATIRLNATAISNVPNHPITQVQFLLNGRSVLGVDTQAPYQFDWTSVPAGTHTITAVAANDNGDTATSAPLSIQVNALPTISLTAPANNSSYNNPSSIMLSASAFDSDGAIARVEFYQGATLLGTATAAPYSIAWSSPPAGSHVLTARAIDNQGATKTSNAANITVSVNTNAAPTVSLTSPANGSSYTGPASIVLAANANDTDGSIAKVEFFQGATLIGSVTSAPYTFNWNNVGRGSYVITARATDNQGAVASSGSAAVTVTDGPGTNTAPTISITAPAGNASHVAPASITLAANANDADGSIAKVEFFNGANLLATVTQAPYAYSWNNVGQGSYNVTAKATDNLGAATTSAPVTVVVSSNAAPTVTLTTPVPDQQFVAPGNIVLNADAADSDGSIAKVEFYQGATLLGTLTDAPYTYLWSNVSAGSYALTAKATDNGGSVTTSAPFNITVTANQLPTVSVSATPTTAVAPATIGLSATANDSDGSVVKVEFYQDITLLGTASAAPYTFNWSNVAAGTYSITAKATDDKGGSMTSAAVAITVNGGGSQVYYIHTDHLNTPRLITDSSNITVWQWDIAEPFGNNAPSASNDFEFNLRFPGQYFDKETNLHYNYFRDYDPSTGRYIQSDPIGLEGGINTYTYVGGNPLSFTDPTGEIAFAPAVYYGAMAIGTVAAGWWAAQHPIAQSSSSSSADTGAMNACPPRAGNEDPCKGKREQLREHERKYQEYIENPSAGDNKGYLAAAYASGDMNRYTNIINGRIKELDKQIQNFRRQLEECERRYGKK